MFFLPLLPDPTNCPRGLAPKPVLGSNTLLHSNTNSKGDIQAQRCWRFWKPGVIPAASIPQKFRLKWQRHEVHRMCFPHFSDRQRWEYGIGPYALKL
jgi:hypothetical protein